MGGDRSGREGYDASIFRLVSYLFCVGGQGPNTVVWCLVAFLCSEFRSDHAYTKSSPLAFLPISAFPERLRLVLLHSDLMLMKFSSNRRVSLSISTQEEQWREVIQQRSQLQLEASTTSRDPHRRGGRSNKPAGR